MAKEEDKTPEYISKHKKLHDAADQFVDVTGLLHNEAYLAGIKKHAYKDGKLDYKLLDDSNVQQAMTKTIKDFYVAAAQKDWKVRKDLDDLEKELLMQAYVGITGEVISRQIQTYGKNLKPEVWAGFQQQIKRSVRDRLYGTAGQHLKDEDKAGIVKHVGLEAKVDAALITVEEARKLLEAFHEDGSITETALREAIPNYLSKKPKKKEDKK